MLLWMKSENGFHTMLVNFLVIQFSAICTATRRMRPLSGRSTGTWSIEEEIYHQPLKVCVIHQGFQNPFPV